MINFNDNIHSNGSHSAGQKTGYGSLEETCQIIDFAVLADYRLDLKESEKIDKSLNRTGACVGYFEDFSYVLYCIMIIHKESLP